MSSTKPTSKQQWTKRFFICIALLVAMFTFSIWSMELEPPLRRLYGVMTIATMLATIVCGIKIATSSTADAVKFLMKQPESTAKKVFLAWIALLIPLLIFGLHTYLVLATDEMSKLNFGAGGVFLLAIIPTMIYVITPVSLVAFIVIGFWARRLNNTYTSDWFTQTWLITLLIIIGSTTLLSLI